MPFKILAAASAKAAAAVLKYLPFSYKTIGYGEL
jgi:hypothetical protein